MSHSSFALIIAALHVMQLQGTFAVSIRGDGRDRVSMATVFLEQNGRVHMLRANEMGDTVGVLLNLSRSVEIRVPETKFKLGDGTRAITIGQQMTLVPHELTPAADEFRLDLHQPTARFLTFSSEVESTTDRTGRWFVLPGPGASYSFDAAVANLPSPEVVSSYLAFHTGAFNTLYLHGLLIRVEEDVDLGTSGMGLHFDTEPYDYGDPPAPFVQTVYIGDSPEGNSLRARIHGVGHGSLGIQVSGVLRSGDNLVLIADPAGGTISRASSINLAEHARQHERRESSRGGGTPNPPE